MTHSIPVGNAALSAATFDGPCLPRKSTEPRAADPDSGPRGCDRGPSTAPNTRPGGGSRPLARRPSPGPYGEVPSGPGPLRNGPATRNRSRGPGRTRPATRRAATCEDHHERPALRRHCVDRVPSCHRLHPWDDTDVGHRQPAPREAAPPTTARPTRLAKRAHPRRLARRIRHPISHSGIPTHRAHVRGLTLRSGMPGPARTTQAPHHAGPAPRRPETPAGGKLRQ
jgi:hypothetical protein